MLQCVFVGVCGVGELAKLQSKRGRQFAGVRVYGAHLGIYYRDYAEICSMPRRHVMEIHCGIKRAGGSSKSPPSPPNCGGFVRDIRDEIFRPVRLIKRTAQLRARVGIRVYWGREPGLGALSHLPPSDHLDCPPSPAAV
jgi:hypothetical protein